MSEENINSIIQKMTGADSNSSQESNTNKSGLGNLLFCDAKNQQELNSFVKNEKPKLICLVGFEGFGKSTFIGALYELLIQNLQYKGYSFIDSGTYVGFERRVFLRRENKENTSDTKRNVLGENDLLNLVLKSEKGNIHQIVVSDKAGETYRQYGSSDEEVKKDCVLKNTDLIIFFVDALEISGSLPKFNLILEKYESLLNRLRGESKICGRTIYSIVFSKFDEVDEASYDKFSERKAKIAQKFEEKIGVKPKNIYSVNSKDLENSELNDVFAEILEPKIHGEALKELDWVKNDIDNLS